MGLHLQQSSPTPHLLYKNCNNGPSDLLLTLKQTTKKHTQTIKAIPIQSTVLRVNNERVGQQSGSSFLPQNENVLLTSHSATALFHVSWQCLRGN